MNKKTSVGEVLNYHVIPPVFLVFFTAATQILAQVGNPEKSFQLEYLVGNCFAWKCIGSLFAWAMIWLLVPSKKFNGPTTAFGLTPVYKANGELYYFASLGTLILIAGLKPKICVAIYENMGAILGGLNVVALSLCLFLLVRAKLKAKEDDPYLKENKYPILHEFYRGMELHPRLLGVDVKQLTNCRMGMIMWQLLIVIYLIAGWELHGFDAGHLVNVLLQTIYIYKFFRWETGYFNTLDITLDRAGYYLCWGCLVWIPAFYTFHSYFFVYHRPGVSIVGAVTLFILGLTSIWFNYDVDRQKELFRTAQKGKTVKIWGENAQAIEVSYKTADGQPRNSKLLISGWWGVARKINYTFELLAAFLWSVEAGFQYGVWPFLYFIFLTVLLIHRVFRDEEKCKTKYGRGWDTYCSKVPYRLLPYLL
ncbi:7-dehydrocholesterol reductase [Orchesella cincta]|uniref:7-dehydrocholesterol reductase n=1 Tax=Orchesella cincta TaxID=48709 RepID=A0A1D2NBC9_ORCCI|nr:7-dehydrocholesterol reductase [Orchesella cincta]